MYSKDLSSTDQYILNYLESISAQGAVGNNTQCANARCNALPSSCSQLTFLDFSSPTAWANNLPLFQTALNAQNAVILFNSYDKKLLSDTLGIGFTEPWAIIEPYEDYTVITLPDSSTLSHSLNEHTYVPRRLARSATLPPSSEPLSASETTGFSSTISELPSSQYKHFYVIISQKNKLSSTQTAQADIVLDIALVASSNPKGKYLQVKTVGAGCHPGNNGNMTWDAKVKKGYFQNRIHLSLQPDSSLLRITSNDPKNINNVTTYTTTSSYQVGVDISENPGFKATYQVGSRKTSTISDFLIINNTSINKSTWDFYMSLTYGNLNNIFSNDWHDGIKEIPILARANLQPITDTVWFVEEPFAATINLKLDFYIDYYGVWDFYGEPRKSEKKTSTTQKTISLNFGVVHA